MTDEEFRCGVSTGVVAAARPTPDGPVAAAGHEVARVLDELLAATRAPNDHRPLVTAWLCLAHAHGKLGIAVERELQRRKGS